MPHRKKFLLSDLNQRTQTDMDVVLELVCYRTAVATKSENTLLND